VRSSGEPIEELLSSGIDKGKVLELLSIDRGINNAVDWSCCFA